MLRLWSLGLAHKNRYFMANFTDCFEYTRKCQQTLFESKIKYTSKLFWIFVNLEILKGSDRKLEKFLTILNIRTKVMVEMKVEQAVTFLDLKLNKNDDIIDIYCKPSCSRYHNTIQFLSPFVITLLKQNFSKQLNTTKQIAANEGYTSSLINKLVCVKSYLHATLYSHIKSKNNETYEYIFFTYNEFSCHKIINLFASKGLKIFNKTNNNLIEY